MNNTFENGAAGGPPPIPQNQRVADPAAAYRAANWSVGLPLLCLLISMAVGASIKTAPETGRIVAQIGGLAAFLGGIAGLLLAIKALCSKPGPDGERPFVRPISGILLNGGFLALFAWGFVHAVTDTLKRRTASAGFHANARELQHDLKTAAENDRALSPGQAQASIEKMRSGLDAVAQNVSGPNAALAKASRAYLGKLQPLTTNYAVAMNAMLHPPLTDMSGVQQREQLQPRRKLIQQFMTANDQLEAFVTNRVALYREEMRRGGMSEKETQSAIAEVTKAMPAASFEIAQRIREDDRRVGRAMLGMLNILDANFGKWKWNASRQKVEFDNPAELDRFLGLRDELLAAAQEQKKLQVKLMEMASR